MKKEINGKTLPVCKFNFTWAYAIEFLRQIFKLNSNYLSEFMIKTI